MRSEQLYSVLLTLWIEWSMADEEVVKARNHLGRALDEAGWATADATDPGGLAPDFFGDLMGPPLGTIE